MNRRDFLKALGLGAAALAVEPVRKMWFVPSNAPVGSRVERLSGLRELIEANGPLMHTELVSYPIQRGPTPTPEEIAQIAEGRPIAEPGALGMSSGHGPLTFRSDPSPSEWFYREPSDKSYSFTVEARRQEERDLHENPLWREHVASLDRIPPEVTRARIDAAKERVRIMIASAGVGDIHAPPWPVEFGPILPSTRRDG